MAFTCNSCSLAFEDAANQREHMKSEWHRYNLKRRVAQLPAIDEDSFNSKVAALKVTDDNDNKKLDKKEERRRQKEAILEQKRKILENARKAMQQRKDDEILNNKHLDETIDSSQLDLQKEIEIQTEKQTNDHGEQGDKPKQLTEEEEQELLIQEKLKNKVDLPVTTCLFCSPKQNSNFETIEDNIDHMFSKHGLYVPEAKYLVNKSGLLKYLGEKIGFGNVCLCCNYQGKNLEAVREHMKIKRHMRIPYESEDEKLEISEFYDFTTSYSDVVKAEDVNDDDDDDWEDVEGEEGDYSDDEELPANDGAIIQNGHELILPSGKVLGHRSLQRYFRQNLPPEKELSEGQGTVIAAENRTLLNVRDKKEYETQKRVWKTEVRRAKYYDKKFSKNMNNQEHYRDQLLQ